VLLQDPADLLRILVVAVLVYPILVLTLRISGKRTLSSLNAFDFIVTVALGSTLATILLSETVSLLEGVLALVLLVVLQYVVAVLSVRWPASQRLLKSQPTLLLADGDMLPEAMRRHRITESEVRQAARGQGAGDLAELAAVILETDGSLSVITRDRRGSGSSLLDVTSSGQAGPATEAGRTAQAGPATRRHRAAPDRSAHLSNRRSGR
jgi:uncharacterized membrane protein YcaP (DUF421 family)